MPTTDPHLELADYRRRVFAMYAALRYEDEPEVRLAAFRAAKDELFATHPQSPIDHEAQGSFGGLAYWPYEPAVRFVVPLEPDPKAPPLDLPGSDGSQMSFGRIGQVSFALEGVERRLTVYWLTGYAGGIFIPFRDGTSGSESYGGGRYLWDSAKGADLGSRGGEMVIDFNFAYHPSCAHDPRWSCPLAPRENWLEVPIRAGERLAAGQHQNDR